MEHNTISEENKLVSVFIPYYNDEEYLKQSIKSVLMQTYSNIELILLNHASTDSSRNIAHSFDDHRIIHIDLDINYNGGGGVLMNEFINIAKGEYYKFFCADDVMYENCIKDLVTFMDENKKIDFAFGNVEYIDEKDNSFNETWFTNRTHFSINNNELDCLKLYARGCSFLPYIGSIVRKDAFGVVDIDMSVCFHSDASLWVQLFLAEKKIGYLNKIVAKYRIHDGQISAISNIGMASRCCYYERAAYRALFLKCDNVKLMKEIFSDSKYVDQLSDKKDIPFFVSEYFYFIFKEDFTWLWLHDMLQDKEYREHIKNTFGFDLKTFRDMYFGLGDYLVTSESNKKVSPKTKIYSRNPKELNILELIFLELRWVFNIVTLRKIRQRSSNKPENRSL